MAGVACPHCNGHVRDGYCQNLDCAYIEEIKPFPKPPHPPSSDRFQHSRPDLNAWHALSDEDQAVGRAGLAEARARLRAARDAKLDRRVA